MATLRMNVRQWARYHRRLGDRLHEAGIRGARSAAMRVVALMVKRTREARPASANGSPGAVNTGELVRAWKWMASGAASFRVYNDRPYFDVVDRGRRRNRAPPPVAVIREWLIRRVGMDPREADRAAWPISRAIGRRGLRGRRILTGREATTEIEAILEAEILREINRALARRP